MADHRISAVRDPQWISPEDYLELPPVIKGARGPWFTLHAWTPESGKVEFKSQKVLCAAFNLDGLVEPYSAHNTEGHQ
jgi:hypothetical protein